MTDTPQSIAIVGAGLGGLTAASTLRLFGFDVQVYEQAGRFLRIGAGIQMMPNSMKVLRRIAIEARVRGTSFEPYSHLNRQWDTGEVVRDIIVGPDAPLHKGRIAYRAVFPSALMGGTDVGNSRTKWWGTDRHIVIYYTRPDKTS